MNSYIKNNYKMTYLSTTAPSLAIILHAIFHRLKYIGLHTVTVYFEHLHIHAFMKSVNHVTALQCIQSCRYRPDTRVEIYTISMTC